MENRLIELETRSSFQEEMLEELNDALVRQQQQIDQLEKKLTTIDTLISGLGQANGNDDQTGPIPPSTISPNP